MREWKCTWRELQKSGLGKTKVKWNRDNAAAAVIAVFGFHGRLSSVPCPIEFPKRRPSTAAIYGHKQSLELHRDRQNVSCSRNALILRPRNPTNDSWRPLNFYRCLKLFFAPLFQSSQLPIYWIPVLWLLPAVQALRVWKQTVAAAATALPAIS